ncbi:MAG: MBOAT family protein [Microscillaceae bacterium]|nr:MBOAT family protein [Microscillaceae bacterium]
MVASFFVDSERPLIFTDSLFWFFFALVVLIYQAIYQRNHLRNLFLLAFSLFFYYKAGGFFFVLIIFSTLVDYYIGAEIHKKKHLPNRTSLLVLSLVINLGLLAYFKYTYFFTELVNQTFATDFKTQDYLAMWANQLFGTTFDIGAIILPVGISFYTFQTLSYTLDIYRRKIKPVNNLLDFGFYVSFFPQLVAGPIVRAAEFVPQLYAPYRLSVPEYGRAIYMILNGLVKKILISDYISTNFVDRVFQNPTAHSGFENLMAVYGYAIQIYCDFSGYTDIAIGLSLLLGFRLNINFNSPYNATSITDFWRRWHISLSTWLRDYLYISLGGNRSASVFTYVSVPISALFFLVLDGWDWDNAWLLLLLLGVWGLSQLYRDQHWLAYAGIFINLLYCGRLFWYADWFSLGLMSATASGWLLLLLRPNCG